jgi:hypothetical protein
MQPAAPKPAGQTEYKLIDGKYRKVVDGVVDYDWKGF